MSIDVLGSDGVSTHRSIGTVWAFHLSRLSYEFSSSVDGMEVAFSGGAVVTNHPEFTPYVVVPPSDRGGPGPRFAATIPSLHPTAASESGAGELELDIEMVHRTSLASTPAYEVRRGWSEPYGTAIADEAGIGLEASEDWTVYPGRLDLLTDYVGWVPDPSYGTSEAVWHTNGEVIEFTLQLASLDVTTGGLVVKSTRLNADTRAAATELGYIFTFLLGVLLMSMFSVWAWDIETNTRHRWNVEAVQANMDDIAAAVERADEASRLGGNVSYAEEIAWRPTEADESLFWLELHETTLILIDEGGPLDIEISLSGTGSSSHEGRVPLAGVERIWVVHDDGLTFLSLDRPQAVQ